MLYQKKEIVFAVAIIAGTFLILAGFVILFVYNYFKLRSTKEKEILMAIYQAQEDERTRIAEELHDDIGGKLSALKLQNELIRRENTLDQIIKYVDKNAGYINNIVKDIRVIVRNQASQYIIDNGLKHELEQLKTQFSSAYGVKIIFDFNFDKTEFKKDFEVNLFRILQELLHNSIKHAKCSEIKVGINVARENVTIFYSDNGKGFKKQNANIAEGMGLKNIETRIRLFNGKYDFNCVPDKETSYTINFSMNNLKV